MVFDQGQTNNPTLEFHWGIKSRKNKAYGQRMGISPDRKANAMGKGHQTVREVAEIATGGICPRLDSLDRQCSAMRKFTLSD